jgi:uncharacterized protein
MTRCLLVLLVVGACASSSAQPKGTLTMKRYTLVLLHRGTPDPNADAEAIQKGHMANIEAMAKLGKLILAGPIENDDAKLRGIFIFDATEAEVAKLLQGDPAITSHRLAPEVLGWYGPGNITYPGKLGP